MLNFLKKHEKKREGERSDTTKTQSLVKILVVDDDMNYQKILKEKLALSGFQTASAADGEEGLKLALELKPDLVLLDILMPNMDGITMLEKLREKFEYKLPVILLTQVEVSRLLIDAAEKYQIARYYLKANVDLDDLVVNIKGILNLK